MAQKATDWVDWLLQRRKAAVALVGIVIALATQYGWQDNHWVQLFIGVATFLGLYAVPNSGRKAVKRAPAGPGPVAVPKA
jgi:hypothetical protein